MTRRKGRSRPSPALVLAILALVAAVGGTAIASDSASISGLKRGEKKQVKKLIRKIANKRARKISDKRITARAPSLSVAGAKKVNGHAADCPGGTTLIRGYCFDTASRGPVASVFLASDDCASAGGFLPTTLMLRSTIGQIDLGNGPAPDSSYADALHGAGQTNIVFNNGGVLAISNATASEYHCVYPLVR